jgi:hypothetical protein
MGPAFRSRSCRNLFHRARLTARPLPSRISRGFLGWFPLPLSENASRSAFRRYGKFCKRLTSGCKFVLGPRASRPAPRRRRSRRKNRSPQLQLGVFRAAHLVSPLQRAKESFSRPPRRAHKLGYGSCAGFADEPKCFRTAHRGGQDARARAAHRSAFKSANSFSKSNRYPSATSASVSFEADEQPSQPPM